MNDIVINKLQSIQRCVVRAREEYQSALNDFDTNYSKQDAAILNVIRACEQAIDLANHIVKAYKLGIPTSSAESFELLYGKQVISGELAESLDNMVHFRNMVIHTYQRLDLKIVKEVIVTGLKDLLQFGEQVQAFTQGADL